MHSTRPLFQSRLRCMDIKYIESSRLNRQRIRVSREVREFQIWNTYSTRNRMRWSHEHRKRTANRTNWWSLLTRLKIDDVLFEADNFEYTLYGGSNVLSLKASQASQSQAIMLTAPLVTQTVKGTNVWIGRHKTIRQTDVTASFPRRSTVYLAMKPDTHLHKIQQVVPSSTNGQYSYYIYLCYCCDCLILLLLLITLRSRYSDSLRAGRSGVGTPVGAKFSASMQTSSCVFRVSLPRIKWPRCRGGSLLAPSLSKGRVYLNLHSVYSCLVTGGLLSLTYCNYRLCTREVCRM